MSEVEGIDERRLAVENALASAFSDIENDFIAPSQLKNLMTTIFHDHAHLRVWMKKLNGYLANGGSNSLLSAWPDFERLRDELRIGLNARVNMSDDLTRIAAMNWKQKLYHQFDDFNPAIFIKPFMKHNGIMYHVWGLPGSGKTDAALSIVEILLKRDYVVITNIKSADASLVRFGNVVKKGPMEGLYRTVRLTDMLLFCISMRREGRSVVMVWDEISTFFHRQDATTRASVDLTRLLKLVRKFNANVIFIEQIDEGLVTVAEKMLAAKIWKLSQKRLRYSTRWEDRNYNEYLESVPRTKIQFESGDFAGFRVDVELKDMFDAIALEDEGDKLTEIENYLQNVQIKTLKLGSAKKKKTRRKRGPKGKRKA